MRQKHCLFKHVSQCTAKKHCLLKHASQCAAKILFISLWQRPPGNTYGQTEPPGSTTAEAAEFLSQSPRKGYPLLLLPYWTNISELERKLLRILSVENSKKKSFSSAYIRCQTALIERIRIRHVNTAACQQRYYISIERL